MVLGVSSDSAKELEQFVDKLSPQYPIVGSVRASSRYGVRAYPTYYLVSTSGRILAGPTHKKFSNDQLESALRSVVQFPAVADTGRLSGLSRACAKADALGVARALPPLENRRDLTEEESASVSSVRDALNRVIKRTIAEVELLSQGPDYYASKVRLMEICKSFKGLPIEAEAQAQLRRFKSDAAIKAEVSAMQRLMAIRKKFDAAKFSDRRKMKKALIKLEGKIAGTYAERRARTLIQTLKD